MSLSLAKTWVSATVGQPAAQADALRLLDQAADEGVEATLIVGPRLTANGKCYLGRWDGRELVVLELTRGALREWNFNPQSLFQELHTPGTAMHNLTAEPLVGLADVQFDTSDYDGWTPLSGKIGFEIDGPPHRAIENAALQAKYFRPDLRCAVTAMWYASVPVLSRGGELQFQFPPLFSDKNPSHVRGPLVVFVQMFTAENWVRRSGCRKVSNVTAAIITLR